MFYLLPTIVGDWILRPTAELRERLERRIDKDFSSLKDDNRSDLNSRWRTGFEFSYKKAVKGQVVYQYGHDASWTRALNSSTDNSDLLYGYAEFGALAGTLRVGRQPLSKGAERLFEKGDWGNTTRSWDMVRLTSGKWDGWIGRLAVNSSPSKDAQIAGLAYQSNFGESMLVFKHDKRSGPQDDIYVADHRWTNKGKRWETEAEVVAEGGRVGDKKLEAWAGEVRTTFQSTKQLSFFGELDGASGGNRGNTTMTFDQLYPGNHSKYGIMDMQGWRNMKGLSFGAVYKPNKSASYKFEYNHFGLAASDDAWYGDNGKPNKGVPGTFVDPSGTHGGDVGQEFDLSAAFYIDSRSSIDCGLGFFRAGTFTSAFANTGDHDQVWGFVQFRTKL